MKRGVEGRRADRVRQVQFTFTHKQLTAWGGACSVMAKVLERIRFGQWGLAQVPVEEHSPHAKGSYEKGLALRLTSLTCRRERPKNAVGREASSRMVEKEGRIGVVPVRNREEDAVPGGKQKPPVVAIEKLGLELGPVEGDPVEELARYGARLILSSYLHAEVEASLGAGWYERSAQRRGRRHGRRQRGVACGVGQVVIDYPKVRGCPRPFRSAVLAAWQRQSPTLMARLPALDVEGVSPRDYARTLSPLGPGTGPSRSAVSRANERIAEAFEQWRRRLLAEESISSLSRDGPLEGCGWARRARKPSCWPTAYELTENACGWAVGRGAMRIRRVGSWPCRTWSSAGWPGPG